MPDKPQPAFKTLKVFLCHSSGDKPAVRNLYQQLRSDGFSPWLDEEDILPGQPWEETIRKAVRQSDVVIVCLSVSSINKSGFVNKEIKLALDVADEQPEGKIFVIPARLESCEVPDRLRGWQWVDLFDKKGYSKLVRGLKACMQERGINIDELEPAQLRSAFTIGGMDFVLIPAGKFIMGIRDDNADLHRGEKLQHIVQLPDYYIGRFPVTNLQFNEFIKESQIQHEWIQNWQEKLAHPVVNITWRDAMAFCQWLHGKYRDELPAGMSLTLPSEAEWEKAARGEFGKEYPWGDRFDKALCNTWEGGKHGTTPVGAYSPEGDSPYGAVDMAGNVQTLPLPGGGWA
jgi:hypothetical protein